MKKVTIDGNSACAHIAYMLNDLAVIYPITPSSNMAEVCDIMSSNNTLNVYDRITKVIQMQSEAGVAGAVHGALKAGSFTTTFTSSQGLLLMIPNMYKIAGENLPTVFYVASRSLATHALNIFCDHSDIYACLKTGFNILCCNTVQEVNDLSLASHIASVVSSSPFICFFDGFRTSHELNTIDQFTIDDIKPIIESLKQNNTNFKRKGMSSVVPCVSGTNQNPDVFFQTRIANTISNNFDIINQIKSAFEKVNNITKRNYDTIEYFGDKNAENIVISIGSSVEVLKLVSKNLKNTGVINVRVLKPFDEQTFINKLPKNVKNITVLERNLDTNGVDSLTATISYTLFKNKINVELYSGVYGLGGKEFTPNQAIAVYENMTTTKKQNFTVGINDDLYHTSLQFKDTFLGDDDFACRIYGYGSDGSVSSAKNIIKILGEDKKVYSQGYFDYDSKKSGSLTISHIRTNNKPINKPFNSEQVNVVLCNNSTFITKYDMTNCLKENGIFLINTSLNQKQLNDVMPNRMKDDIKNKNLKVYTIDANKIAKENNLHAKINTIMQTALFKVADFLDFNKALEKIKNSIIISYSKKGDEIVNNNLNAIMQVEGNILEIKKFIKTKDRLEANTSNLAYYHEVIKPINNSEGNDIPTSKLLGTGMPTGTTKLEKRGIANQIPEWISEKCIQCGRCSMMCPHSCLGAVEFEKDKQTPKTLSTRKSFTSNKEYCLQVSPLDCTGCGVCSEVCPVKAIIMNESLEHRKIQKENYEYVKNLETSIPAENTCKSLQFKPNYFEFSGACAGCGETPYLKLVTQMFGDRMLIANATGCSSIYGGTFPTCPYAKDEDGFGPSWANSLFEDNAEFGYGIAVSKRIERENYINTLKENKNKYSPSVKSLVKEFLKDTENHSKNKEIAISLRNLWNSNIKEIDKEVLNGLNLIIKPSCWIIGGDGWAYDIGFGGLDHVVASGENVNILILDTELYSNTGCQTSKSTPRGASAKFNSTGKSTMKKDLLTMLMTYKNVYVAQVAMGANPDQCIKAFEEAEKFNGPSVILAYSPCINHGYDMKYSQTHVLNSVKSGYNTLFRYSPMFESGIVVDSFDPTMNYREYLDSENRFKILSKTNPNNKDTLLNLNEKDSLEKIKNLKK